MKTQIVRVAAATHEKLKELSAKTGEPMTDVLSKAVESYRRETLLRESNAAFFRLKEDKELWKEELTERREWESTLEDGLSEK